MPLNSKVKTNLQAGKIRLVFVSDEFLPSYVEWWNF